MMTITLIKSGRKIEIAIAAAQCAHEGWRAKAP